MKPITLREILPFPVYEQVRARLRPLFIAEKERHRLAVGAHLTLIFENAQTVWYQIEEMLRTERIEAAEAVQHEVDTYNELLPTVDELSATLLIEYPEVRQRDAALRRLVGLEKHLWLVAPGHRRCARFDTRQMSPDRISSVQFVRFPVGGIEARRLAELAEMGSLAVEADHRELSARASVPPLLAKLLLRELYED